MPNRTVIGYFEPSVDTDRLVLDLVDLGFNKGDILILGRDDRETARPEDEPLTTLFQNRGIPDAEAGYFAEGVRRGGVVVTINTASIASCNEAAELLNRYGALDIEERVSQWNAAAAPADRAHEAAAGDMSAVTIQRATEDDQQTGRIRGSRVFVW